MPDIPAMLTALAPIEPVYCVSPKKYALAAGEFLGGFPGRVLYAVKANNEPAVIDALYAGGIRHFDCASLVEIELIKSLHPDAVCYFMSPVRLPGAARDAQRRHATRHFMIDNASALAPLVQEIDPHRCVIFARMAVHHDSAVEDLSSKFGAPPDEVPGLLQDIAACGAEPALAFNVGSGVTSPDAYRHALDVAADVLGRIGFTIRLLDIGGGFPRSYPGYEVPELDQYFDAIISSVSALPLADDAELLAEPGRALAAPGLTAVVRVLLRKDDRIYLNDGMYGAFWELRFYGHKQYPVQAYRDGTQLRGAEKSFAVFGPTCDASDRLPERVSLPADLRVGDYLAFGSIGAYSLSGRTHFNGFYSDTIVAID